MSLASRVRKIGLIAALAVASVAVGWVFMMGLLTALAAYNLESHLDDEEREYMRQHGRELAQIRPQWTPDGRLVVFSDGRGVYTIMADGSRFQPLYGNPSGDYGATSPSISPDGLRVAYTAFEHSSWLGTDYQWDIVTSKLDGSDRHRLTESGNNFVPTWSPDGSRIAFVASGRISVMDSDGSNVRTVVSDIAVSASAFFAWSPDGRRLAFVAVEPDSLMTWYYPQLDKWYSRETFKDVLYTVGADGTGLTRIGESAGTHSWSPDGRRLAFKAREPDSPREVLYTVGADGTGLTRIGESASTPSWSPDSGRIAFAKSDGDTHVAIVTTDPDGANEKTVFESSEPVYDVAWSPDGTRIAISGLFGARGSIRVVAADGFDPPGLGTWFDVGPGPTYWSPDSSRLAFLSYGGVRTVDVRTESVWSRVPPSLKADYEVLLRTRDSLFGRTGSNWSEYTSTPEWEGVQVSGQPPRVTGLDLTGKDLRGAIPPGIGNLTAMSYLDLSDNSLTGPIPPELGKLTGLERLDLSNNKLSGPIPPELGKLTRLERLNLSNNELSGPIPPELGKLAELVELFLGANSLSGPIPPELGELTSLKELVLSGNELDGPIPPELSRLTNLKKLYLDDNRLVEGIPPELAALTRVVSLRLAGNDLSGCVPSALPYLWVSASGLGRCKLKGF